MYTNRTRNPLALSSSIEFRYEGTGTSNEEVADDYVSKGYEPGVGTIYRNTAGGLFYHFKSGIDANDWETLVAGTPGPDQETYSVTATLTPKITKKITVKAKSVTGSLTSRITKKTIVEAKSVTTTLAPGITTP